MRPHAAEGVLLQVAVGHVQGVGDEAELEGVADAVEVMGEVRGPRLQRRGGPRLCFLQGLDSHKPAFKGSETTYCPLLC